MKPVLRYYNLLIKISAWWTKIQLGYPPNIFATMFFDEKWDWEKWDMMRQIVYYLKSCSTFS